MFNIRILFIGDARMIHFRRLINFIYDNYNIYSVVLSNHDHQDLHANKIIIDECITRSRRRWLQSCRKVRKISRDYGIDIVHVHYIPSGFTSLFISCPLITTVYGGDVSEIPFKDSIWERVLSRIVLRKSSRILADAHDLIAIMKDRLGIRSRKMKYFQWGVDLETFNINNRTNKFTGKFNIPQDKTVILSFRGWTARYNILTILNAYSRLKKLNDNVILVIKNTAITYDHDYKELIEKRLNQDDLIGKVVLVPNNIHYSELCELLYSSDIYVSIPDVDGTAMSLLESMACGLLPLLSDIPAAREWIKDGVNGILCDISEDELLNAFQRILDIPRIKIKQWQEVNAQTIFEKADERKWMEMAYQMYLEARRS